MSDSGSRIDTAARTRAAQAVKDKAVDATGVLYEDSVYYALADAALAAAALPPWSERRADDEGGSHGSSGRTAWNEAVEGIAPAIADAEPTPEAPT